MAGRSRDWGFPPRRLDPVDRPAQVDVHRGQSLGCLAAALAGLEAGVQILRVHDVAETAQAVRVWQAIKAGG